MKKFLFATLLAATALTVNAQKQPINLSNAPARPAHGFTDENEELPALNHGTGLRIGAAWTDVRTSALSTHRLPGSFEVGVFHQRPFTRFFSMQPELLYYREHTATTTRSGLRLPVLLVMNPFQTVSVHFGPQLQVRIASKAAYPLPTSSDDLATAGMAPATTTRVSLAFAAGAEARVGFLRVGLRYAVPLNTLGNPAAAGKQTGAAWKAGQVQAYLGAGF